MNPETSYWVICHRETMIDWNHAESDQEPIKPLYIEDRGLNESERTFMTDLLAKQQWHSTLDEAPDSLAKCILKKSLSTVKFPAMILGVVCIHEWIFSNPKWEEVRETFDAIRVITSIDN